MMKRVFTVMLAVMMLLLTVGCSGGKTTTEPTKPTEKPAPTTVKIVAINGPTGVGLAHLRAAEDGANHYEFTGVSAPDKAVAALLNGEADLAAVPTNLAASLFNKTGGEIQVLAANTTGVLYLVENGDTVHALADLKGKTILSTGQGANPEFIFKQLLKNSELADDVTMEFTEENSAMAAALVSGKSKLALVPEPLVSTVLAKNPDLRVALNVNDLWSTVSDKPLLMGCVAARKAFVEEHPDAIRQFLTDYQGSIEAAADVDATAALCEQFGIIESAAIAKQAIPRCGLTFVVGTDLKAALTDYYQVLFNAAPQAIGGKMPADIFYYGA